MIDVVTELARACVLRELLCADESDNLRRSGVYSRNEGELLRARVRKVTLLSPKLWPVALLQMTVFLIVAFFYVRPVA